MLNIPKDWTFRDAGVASGFDAHVREQLPWYELATHAVAHLGRHYIPTRGLVYDIGASTGNIGRAIRETLEQRDARLVAIEESAEMAELYSAPGRLIVTDALTYDYDEFDFGVCFLALMFFPVATRRAWLERLVARLRPGGALVVVDKTTTPAGYVGTSLRRLAMAWKVSTGTSADDIVRKELALAGYQRPVSPELFDGLGVPFFQLGEFCGWVIEKPE